MRDGKHKVKEMDGGNHLSPETAFKAMAAPAAPAEIPSPEMVVVLVTVPSGAVVSVTVHDEIPSAIVMMLTCFIFIFF